jgi:hypothetical protein
MFLGDRGDLGGDLETEDATRKLGVAIDAACGWRIRGSSNDPDFGTGIERTMTP